MYNLRSPVKHFAPILHARVLRMHQRSNIIYKLCSKTRPCASYPSRRLAGTATTTSAAIFSAFLIVTSVINIINTQSICYIPTGSITFQSWCMFLFVTHIQGELTVFSFFIYISSSFSVALATSLQKVTYFLSFACDQR